MKYIRENGMYFFAECESCGNEMKALKTNCNKARFGFLSRNWIFCTCGNGSRDIKTELKRNPVLPSTSLPTEIITDPEEAIEQPVIVEDKSVKCPKCKSTQIMANNKGFGLGKAVAGGLVLGPVGLLGGLFGSKKLMISCMKCGNRWQVGK